MLTCSMVPRATAASVVLGSLQPRLAGEESRERVDLVLRQLLRERLHERILALAEPVVVQRLRDVVRVLAGEARVVIRRPNAIRAMTGGAGCRLFGRSTDHFRARA